MRFNGAQPPRRGACRRGLEDLDHLADREADLVVAREEVRADADTGARAEVAQDRPLLQLGIDGRRLGHVDDDRSTAP